MWRNSSADRPKRRRASWSSACQTSSRAQAASQPLLPSGTPCCSWTQPNSGDSGVRRSPVTHPTHRTFTLCLARSAVELRPQTESVLPPARPESPAHQSASSPRSPPKPYLSRTQIVNSPINPRNPGTPTPAPRSLPHPILSLRLPPRSRLLSLLPVHAFSSPPPLTPHFSSLSPSSPLSPSR